MSLEQDIYQEDFRNEFQKALLNMVFTNYHVVDKMNVVFKKHDITRQQYNVLRILKGQLPGHASINLIKDRMLDKMSDASRIVERLRIKGLVTRDFCEKDKRSVEVRITQTGLTILDRMQPEVEGFEHILHNLTEEETHQLNYLLDKIRGSDKVKQTNSKQTLEAETSSR
ncbi:MAG TPA: MarR family transcriptional regulator [Ohtaekwangia sp.]|uniref:MarR family winged helix-turn-helix transcriptional regulator n=1 Tax=Ohtaekwangia sp. TaxID=2066019 RepID=UPI002F922E7F